MNCLIKRLIFRKLENECNKKQKLVLTLVMGVFAFGMSGFNLQNAYQFTNIDDCENEYYWGFALSFIMTGDATIANQAGIHAQLECEGHTGVQEYIDANPYIRN